MRVFLPAGTQYGSRELMIRKIWGTNNRAGVRVQSKTRRHYLDPPTSSPQEQKQDNDQKHDAETATAVVANAGTHVVATPTEDQQKNHENQN